MGPSCRSPHLPNQLQIPDKLSVPSLCAVGQFQPGQVIWDLAWGSAETPGPTARLPGGIKVWSRCWTDQPEGGDERKEQLWMERRARV